MIEDYFISITRKTLTQTKNSKYENVNSYTNSTILGYVGSRTDIESFDNGKWTIKTQYKFYANTNCLYGDIIVYNGENYRIIGDMQNTVNLNHHYKGLVEKLENID